MCAVAFGRFDNAEARGASRQTVAAWPRLSATVRGAIATLAGGRLLNCGGYPRSRMATPQRSPAVRAIRLLATWLLIAMLGGAFSIGLATIGFIVTSGQSGKLFVSRGYP